MKLPPLFEAVMLQKPDIALIQSMIQNGTDVNHLHVDGSTAMHYAVRRGDPRTIQLLIEHGVDVSIRDRSKGQETPLDLAANFLASSIREMFGFDELSQDDTYEVFRLLLENGADCNSRRDGLPAYGFTPFHIALQCHSLKIFKLLLDYGADIDFLNSRDGDKAIQLAAINRNVDVMEFLLDQYGYNIECISRIGNSLLHEAAENSNAEGCEFLLTRRGAMLHEKNRDGKTPLTLAISHGNMLYPQ